MRAINSVIMKQLNRRMVLDCIRRRPISRAELSDETQLTRASITQIVDGLMREGLVEESAVVDRRSPGRRQTQLTIVKDALCIAGMVLGARRYDLGLMNLAGDVIWHSWGQTGRRNVYEILDEIADRLREAARIHAPENARMHGLGVCMPSPLDRQSAGRRMHLDYSDPESAILAAEMHKRLSWEIYMGNISNAYALDELYFGLGRRGVENFMVLRVDENVGAGFIIKGRLFVGARGFSPEIGHITLIPNGPRCKCGNRGCLENYISVPAILKGSAYSEWRRLVDAVDEDPHAEALFRREAEYLAFEIVNLANVLDLDKVVVTGQLVYGGDRLAEMINRCMDESFVHRMGRSSVVAGGEINIARVATMPAYHAIFAC